MSWHLDASDIRRYQEAALGRVAAASLEAHLTECGECRSLLVTDRDWLERSWSSIAEIVEPGRPGVVEQTLARMGVPSHVARIVAVSPALRISFLLAVVLVMVFSVLWLTAFRGLGHFWPKAVAETHFIEKDGTRIRIIGEVREEQEVAVPKRRRGGRGGRRGLVLTAVLTALLLVAGMGAGGVAVASNWDSLPIAAWFGAEDGDGDRPEDEEGAAGSDRSADSSEEPSEEPSDDPSEEDGAAEDEDDGDGSEDEDGEEELDGGGGSTTTMATVGAGVGASGTRPSGSHVVAFQPEGGSGRYAVVDGATVVCAWSFCQGQGGSVGNGNAGSVASSPAALTAHVNSGSRTISAEVTYTEGSDGTVTITRLVEHHRTSGSGTPPW